MFWLKAKRTVDAGVRLFNEFDPQWWMFVDPHRVDMSNPVAWPITQLANQHPDAEVEELRVLVDRVMSWREENGHATGRGLYNKVFNNYWLRGFFWRRVVFSSEAAFRLGVV